MLTVNSNWLNDSIKIETFKSDNSGEVILNDYGEVQIDKEVTCDKVRVDYSPIFSGTDNNRQLIANGVVFIYSDFSVFSDFGFQLDPVKHLGSRIVINGDEDLRAQVFTINKIVPISKIEETGIFSWEVEFR